MKDKTTIVNETGVGYFIDSTDDVDDKDVKTVIAAADGRGRRGVGR